MPYKLRLKPTVAQALRKRHAYKPWPYKNQIAARNRYTPPSKLRESYPLCRLQIPVRCCESSLRTKFKKKVTCKSSSRSARYGRSVVTWMLPGCYLGRLAPYLERDCFLSVTPTVSRTPLTMWYLTPGRSLTLPPLMRTTECS